MSQDFLERCNEKMQSLYDCCGKKVNELYAIVIIEERISKLIKLNLSVCLI